ncbi:MAG: 50S ribosomal protein L9 [Chitinophagales bacterium]
MEIILKKDVEKLGYADDLVKVKPGYALNYLIPQGFAVLANDTNRKLLSGVMRGKEKREEKLVAQLNDIKKRLSETKLTIGAKVGTTDKIFGSVTAHHVAEAIRKVADIEVDRRKIHIVEGEVKTVGNYTAEIGLGRDQKITVGFEVVAE